jgi:hypothetical protein
LLILRIVSAPGPVTIAFDPPVPIAILPMSITLLLLPLLIQGAPAAESVSFNRDIRPILSDNCFTCHGPDAESRKGKLRLDTLEGATRVRRGRTAIAPGNLEASELVDRILMDDEFDVMPPKETGKHLDAEEKAMLLRWIEEGAEYQDHWAYIAPQRPDPPAEVDAAWTVNPIDRFLRASLESHGLEPAELADPVTLVRRLHFDLIGLPPTPEVVERYAADPSAAAYAELVDGLLESEHYGERMASYWLDLVRYADTMGYHSDDQQKIFPYRDYVISAFNRNMGFDQFTTEQLAGDLMENSTLEQKVASGYNRLNQVTGEGGAQPGEYIAKYMADRIRTTSEVWLGATLGCAECHDHKYDPFTAKDFYRFGAFFADLEQVGVYSGVARSTGNYPPAMNVPQAGEEQRAAQLEERTRSLRMERDTQFSELLASAAVPEETTWELGMPRQATSSGVSSLALLADGSVLSTGERTENQNYSVVLDTKAGSLGAIRLDLLPDASFKGLSRGNGNVVLSGFEARIVSVEGDRALSIASVVTNAETRGDWHPAGILDEDPLSGWAAGMDDGDMQRPRILVFRLAEPVLLNSTDSLHITMRHEAEREFHNIGRFRLALSADIAASISGSIWDDHLRGAILAPASERSQVQASLVRTHVSANEPEPFTALVEQLRVAEEEQRQFAIERTKTMISRAVEPKVTRLLRRGDWLDAEGEVVEPGVPHFLPQPETSQGERLTRLDLAEWLLDESNPLTARVFVNRLWYLMFGNGLSNVLNDLGSQGDWPSHPALLDWLAVEFRASGWDVKHMLRLLVNSRAYQLSSSPSPEQAAADPLNSLHARQARFRLQAEFVRDNALAISGLLQRERGGPSVKPYQPAGYWSDSYKSVGVPHKYEPSTGPDLYRRGLYTLWKRSFLHPSLLAFDAPLREACEARRPVSNTPLQALVLLNDPTYVEAARAFALRAMQEASGPTGKGITWIVRQALGRAPNALELETLLELHALHLKRYSEDGAAAEALAGVGEFSVPEQINLVELAAWTSVTRVVLNLHETITRN